MVILSSKIIMDIGKGAMLSVKVSYRFSCAHPCITSMLFFLLILYRAFPSLFAFLVSSSPVIFCTAIILGTILSYGTSNIPEVDEDNQKTPKISSLQVGGVVDDLVVKEDESLTLEANYETYTEVKERAVEQAVLGEASNTTSAEILKYFPSEIVRADRNDDNDTASASIFLLQEERKEIHCEMEITDEREVLDQGFVEKEECSVEKQAEHAVDFDVEVPSVSNDQKVEGLVQISQATADSPFYSSLGSSWQPVDSDDVSCGSDSDDAESSSPDASMADILPMLDELHPLLESEYSQSITRVTDNSDASSSGSSEDHKSDDDGIPEDEVENEVTKGESLGNHEVAVTWTADDQKNVMDLGISELERNQRLENLIAKRRLRKLQRLETEKNLIDLDVYYPTSIPSISVPKPNPFDLPYDSDGNLDFHPIPGSAPSVLQPRQNPFDLPYDHDEIGAPSLEYLRKADFFPAFRGHVGSNRGAPSSSNVFNQAKSDSMLKTSYLAETTDREKIELSPFGRELSQKNDSKMHSDFEFDMVSPFTGQKHHEEPTDQEINHETVMSSMIGTDVEHAEQDSQPFEEVDSVDNQHEQHRVHIASNHALSLNISRVMEVIGEADHLPYIDTGKPLVCKEIYEDSNWSPSQENDKSPSVNGHEEFASLKQQSETVDNPQVSAESSISLTDPRKSIESEVGFSLLSSCEDPEMTVYNSQLHVLDACSFEELDSVFKQHHVEDIVPPVSGLNVDNSVATRSDIGTRELDIANRNQEQTGSDVELLLLEAKSVEDFTSALKQLTEPFVDEVGVNESGISEIEPSELLPEETHFETWNTNSDLHVIEAKTLEDLNLFLKQPREVKVESLPEELNHANAESSGRNLSLEVLEVSASERHTETEATEKHFEPQVNDVKASEEHIGDEVLDVSSEESEKQIEPEACNIHIENEVLDVLSSKASEIHIENEVLDVPSEASEKHIEPEASETHIEPEVSAVQLPLEATEKQSEHEVLKVLLEASEKHIEPEVSEKHIEPVSSESSDKHIEPELVIQSSEEIKFYSEEAATTQTTTADEETSETLGEDAALVDASRRARKGKSGRSSSNSSSSSSDSSDSE